MLPNGAPDSAAEMMAGVNFDCGLGWKRTEQNNGISFYNDNDSDNGTGSRPTPGPKLEPVRWSVDYFTSPGG